MHASRAAEGGAGFARRMLAVALVAASCASSRPPPPLALPAAPPGTVAIAARALAPAGDVTVIELAVTSEHANALALDRTQVFARTAPGPPGVAAQRVAPLAPAEAARRAGSAGLPDAARSSAYGAAEGGVRGAATGAVTGGGAGGMVGAAVGAIGGVFRGMQGQPADVAGYESRALANIPLRPGMSVTGLVYFPAGDYADVEVVLVGDDEVVRMLVPLPPPLAEE
jgi:hypothetical protein